MWAIAVHLDQWTGRLSRCSRLNHARSSQSWRTSQKRSKPPLPKTSCDTTALNVRLVWNVERSITLINHKPTCHSQQTLLPQLKQTKQIWPSFGCLLIFKLYFYPKSLTTRPPPRPHLEQDVISQHVFHFCLSTSFIACCTCESSCYKNKKKLSAGWGGSWFVLVCLQFRTALVAKKTITYDSY